MSDRPDFGDLRSLMNEPYSRQIWDQICEWVAGWDPDDRSARVLPYLDGHLHQWTDEERFVPKSWLDTMMNDEELPYLSVARYLNLRGKSRVIGWRAEVPTFVSLWTYPSIACISTIDLGHNTFHVHEYDLLFASEHLTGLEHLRLSHTDPDQSHPGWLSGIKPSPFSQNLRSLDLSSCNLDEKKLAPLLEADTPILHTLSLSKNSFNGNYLSLLPAALPALKSLDIAGNALDGISIAAIESWPALHTLDVSRAGLERDAWRTLLAPSMRESLTTLRAWQNVFSTDSVSILFGEEGFHAIDTLELPFCQIFDMTLEALLGSGAMQRITHLNLANNNLTDRSLELLLDASASLEHLRSLNLLGNSFSPQMVEQIRTDSTFGPITNIR